MLKNSDLKTINQIKMVDKDKRQICWGTLNFNLNASIKN